LRKSKSFIASLLFVVIFCIFPTECFCEEPYELGDDSIYAQWLKTKRINSFFGILPDTSVAISDDAYALWNNPAGIHFQSKSKKTASSYLSTTHNQRDQDSWDFVFASCFGNFGFGYSQFKSKDPEFRLDTYIMGSKFNIKDLFSVGLSLKRFNSTFEEDGDGYSIDGGFLIRPHPYLSFGFTVRNINEPHFGECFEINRTYVAGFAVRPFDDRLTCAVDWTFSEKDKPNDFIFDFRIETELIDGVIINAFMDNDKNFGLTAGINIPYAGFFYTNRNGEDFENLHHQVSLKLFSDRKRSFFVPEKKIFKREEIGVQRKISCIRKSAEKREVKGLIITIKPLKAGMFGQLSGVAQEIKKAILYARLKGKKVVAYIEGDAGTIEYYIATGADKIIMPPTGAISGLGTYISILRVKDFLKKIGIGLEYQTVGKYKSTFHAIAEKATPEQQEMIRSLIDDLYGQLLDSLTEGRDIARDKAEEICNGSIYSAIKGKELGLIDLCGYKKDAVDLINQLTGLEISEKDLKDQRKIDTIYDYRPTWGIPRKIAIIGAYGIIKTGKSGEDYIFGRKTMGSDTIIQQLKEAKKDPLVKAVIIRIDSGGGSGVASDLIFNMINEVRAAGKKVIISMADVAGSGGYWISAPGDVIIANPATITGSIGVMGAKIYLEELFDKLNIKSETYKKGEYSDIFSLYRGYTEEEREMVKEIMNDFYNLFIKRVAESRNLSEEEVRNAAEGRVYTGRQALKVHLVDEMGGLSHAIEVAKDLANITEEPEIVVYLQKRSFLLSLIGETVLQQLNLKNLISDEFLQLRITYPNF